MLKSNSSTALDRSETLSSKLVARMRDDILRGDLAPGQHLPDRELCERFAVSRGLVREAVQSLAGEGLVTIIPHRGPIVSKLDRKSARELYKVRGVLEGLASAEFAEFADDAMREELFAIMERLAGLTEAESADRLVEEKNAYYDCLLTGCNNETVALMFRQLNNRIIQLRRLSLSQPGRLANTQKEIAAIVDAIRRRDGRTARELAEAHVAKAAEVADLRFAELETVNNERRSA